jgi:Mrp family chromosome partitioning ATPase
MQDLVDGFQLVVRSRRTPKDAIHETIAKLRSDRIIGVVFNGHREYKSSYKTYGYRRYGMMSVAAAPKGLIGRLTTALRRLRSAS